MIVLICNEETHMFNCIQTTFLWNCTRHISKKNVYEILQKYNLLLLYKSTGQAWSTSFLFLITDKNNLTFFSRSSPCQQSHFVSSHFREYMERIRHYFLIGGVGGRRVLECMLCLTICTFDLVKLNVYFEDFHKPVLIKHFGN